MSRLFCALLIVPSLTSVALPAKLEAGSDCKVSQLDLALHLSLLTR